MTISILKCSRQSSGKLVRRRTKTTGVVVGADPGSKAAKGKKLGLKILNEAAFKRLVGSSPAKK